MSEEQNAADHVSATGFRTTQVSFDEEGRRKQRRRKDKEADFDGGARPHRVAHNPEDDAVTECPGCGIEIDESEFVETLLSFVTGSKDYLGGDPVRVRSVQRLQQIMPGGKMPDPRSDWGVEVVSRIEQHIEKMAEERVRMIVSRERLALESEIRHQFEVEIRDQFIAAFRGLAPLPLGLEETDLLPPLQPIPTFEQFSPVATSAEPDTQSEHDVEMTRRANLLSSATESSLRSNTPLAQTPPTSTARTQHTESARTPSTIPANSPAEISTPEHVQSSNPAVGLVESADGILPVSIGPASNADADIDEDGVAWWQDASSQWWYQPPSETDWFAWA